jgi:hypothetical protein
MKQLFKKLRCWIFEHVWFVDGVNGDAVCVDCGKEMK